MIYCKKCGVELEPDMTKCPLCGTSINETHPMIENSENEVDLNAGKEMTPPQKRVIWEIVSITIISAVIATFSIDFLMSHRISWSEYPVAVSLMVFSYVSSFAFLRTTTVIKIATGLLGASGFVVLIDLLTNGLQWAFPIAIPVLFTGNAIAAVLMMIFKKVKRKGVNLVAYALLAIGIYMLGLEAIFSIYKTGVVALKWSVIVLACVVPVAFVLIYVHFRLTKNKSLERIFHR
ncbi:DUF6320 domain-containing protein [Geofilum sp. OHC36d9]|uniref:DUF6320 domain-containing protein n=1 Tax=Geofilum sp. OHC36d9 TaxID=3458413 RepID=UPI004033B358